MYIKHNFLKTFIPLPPLVKKRDSYWWVFFVMPEDVQVEKGFTAKRAHQPHS